MAKILLTEDDKEIRTAYAFVLTRSGHQVLEASNAAEAKQLLPQHPDVLVLDMLMPGLYS